MWEIKGLICMLIKYLIIIADQQYFESDMYAFT